MIPTEYWIYTGKALYYMGFGIMFYFVAKGFSEIIKSFSKKTYNIDTDKLNNEQLKTILKNI